MANSRVDVVTKIIGKEEKGVNKEFLRITKKTSSNTGEKSQEVHTYVPLLKIDNSNFDPIVGKVPDITTPKDPALVPTPKPTSMKQGFFNFHQSLTKQGNLAKAQQPAAAQLAPTVLDTPPNFPSFQLPAAQWSPKLLMQQAAGSTAPAVPLASLMHTPQNNQAKTSGTPLLNLGVKK